MTDAHGHADTDARAREIAAALDEYDRLGEKSFYEISDQDNIRARQIRDDMGDWLRELLAERERLLATLEWYADMDIYNTNVYHDNDNQEWCEGAILSDLGARARVVLGRPTKGDLAALDADASERDAG